MPGDISDWMNTSGFLNAGTALAARTVLGVLTAGAGSTTGSVFYCDSTTGTSGGAGTIASPTATIKQALALCTANKGDVVVCFPGHAETIVNATDLAISKAGVSVISLGTGAARATITYGTATSASIPITGANVLVRGLRLLCNIDSCVTMMTAGADDITIENCDFIGQSGAEALCGLAITTTKDNTIVRGCRFIQPTDPAGTNGNAATGAIYLVDSENVLVEGCEFRGNWETACVHNKTTGCANFWMRNCYGLVAGLTTDMVPFVFVSTATGGVERSSFVNPNEAATTEATLSGTFPALMFNFQSYFGNDGGGGQLAIASQAAAT